MSRADIQNIIEKLLRGRTNTPRLYHSPLFKGDKRAFEMNAEQFRSAEVAANVFCCESEVLIVLPRLIHRRCEKTGVPNRAQVCEIACKASGVASRMSEPPAPWM